MKIKSPRMQSSIAAILSIVSLFAFLSLFGVFQDEMTLREELRSAPVQTLLSLILALSIYPAVIYLTKLDANEIEDIQTRNSINGDVQQIDVAFKRLKELVNTLPRDNIVLRISTLILEVVKNTIEYMLNIIDVDDMVDAQSLRILFLDYVASVESYVTDLQAQKYDRKAADRVRITEEKVPNLLIGFVDLMNKVKPTGNEQALKNVETKMRAWGYLGTLDILEERERQKKERA